MIFIDPLKILEKLWDKIAESKISQKRKDFLLTLVSITFIINSFWLLFLIQQITNLISTHLGKP